MTEAQRDSYVVTWSDEDGEWVATDPEYPSLSWLAGTPLDALSGLLDLIDDPAAEPNQNLRAAARRWRQLRGGGAPLAPVEALIAQWEADESEYLARVGQHMSCSLATVAEQVRAALGSAE